MEVAYQVGEAAGDERQQLVHNALLRIVEDAARGRVEAKSVTAPEDNLVWDLAGAIERERGVPERTLAAVRDSDRTRVLETHGRVDISLDAIAGAVRNMFGETPHEEVNEHRAIIAIGGLVMAVTVADDPDAADRSEGAQVDPRDVPIKRPWQMSHPILLSPAAWLLATAYQPA
jgi:hypothetical protein